MSDRLPWRDDEHACEIQQLAANDEAKLAEPPPNLSPAIIKLAYRLSQLKSGGYDITLLKHDNHEMGVVVTGRGKMEVLKGHKK